MTKEQIAVFIAEHKWDYRRGYLRLFGRRSGADDELSSVFGFTAALLETLPFVGLIFSVSNRVGAAMWAHGMQIKFIGLIGVNSDSDLEKRQHWFSEKKRKSS